MNILCCNLVRITYNIWSEILADFFTKTTSTIQYTECSQISTMVRSADLNSQTMVYIRNYTNISIHWRKTADGLTMFNPSADHCHRGFAQKSAVTYKNNIRAKSIIKSVIRISITRQTHRTQRYHINWFCADSICFETHINTR